MQKAASRAIAVAIISGEVILLGGIPAKASGRIVYGGSRSAVSAPVIPGKVVRVPYFYDTGRGTPAAAGLITGTVSTEQPCPTAEEVRNFANSRYTNIERDYRSDLGYVAISDIYTFQPFLSRNDPNTSLRLHGRAHIFLDYTISTRDAGRKLCLWPALAYLRTPNSYLVEGPAPPLLVEIPNTVQTLPTPKIWSGPTSIEQGGNVARSDISRRELQFTVPRDSGLERSYRKPTAASLRSRKLIVFFPKFNSPIQTDSQGVYGGSYSLDPRTNLVTRNRAPFIAIGPNQNGLTNSVWSFSKTPHTGGSDNPFWSFGCTGEGWGCDENTNPTPKLNLATTAMLAIDSARDREPNAGSLRYAYVCAMQLVHWFSDRPSDNRFVLSKPRCARLAP